MRRITITDKQVKNVLDLSPEEEVLLLRYDKVDPVREAGAIVSPVLVVCGDKKFEVDLIGQPTDLNDNYGDQSQGKEKGLSKVKIRTELPPELFKELVGVKDILLLARTQNVPSYIMTNRVSVEYDKTKDAPPMLVVSCDKFKPIDDLLKAQISEPTFYEVFIEGNNEGFYNAEGEQLDNLIEPIGVKRRIEEGDTELRQRVIEYLKFRLQGTVKVKDEEIKTLIEQAEVDQKIDEASKSKTKTARPMMHFDMWPGIEFGTTVECEGCGRTYKANKENMLMECPGKQK